MPFLTPRRILRRCAILPLALLSALSNGCAQTPAPVQPPVGHWHGAMAAGNAAVPSVWEIRADGTQSVTLMLPQGAMTAEGTWAAQGGILTERTTIRAVLPGREQKTVVLASPMEATFAYHLEGGTLTLTRADTHQQIVLTREADADGR